MTSSKRVRKAWLVLAAIFLVVAVYGSLVSDDKQERQRETVAFQETAHQFASRLREWTFGASRVDWGVNVLLFIPISFCAICAIAPTGSSRAWQIGCTAAVASFCAMTTLAVEFAQNWVPDRVSSPADVFAQFLGAAIGLGAWVVVGDAASFWLDGYLRDRRPNKQIDWLLQAYLIGLVLYSVMPIDLTIRPGELYGKFKSGQIVLIPFTHEYGSWDRLAYHMLADTAVFVPVGILAATVLTPESRPVRSLIPSMAVGLLVVVGIEAVQLIVKSRFTDATDVVMGAIGVWLGILVTHRWYGKPPAVAGRGWSAAWKWCLAGGLYALLLVAIFWAPFNFVTDRDLIRRNLDHFFVMPLSSAILGDPFVGISTILRHVVWFAPLGAIIAVATHALERHARRLARVLSFIAVLGLALVIELGQTALRDQSATFDDALICAGGALLGLLAARRVLSGTTDQRGGRCQRPTG